MTDTGKFSNYIISCHKDKRLKHPIPKSEFDVEIQAGAALTTDRICELNDHDGFRESISDRNSRYSEATAMWWIYKHIESEYVGISHYRRRLNLEEKRLSELLNKGIDLITVKPIKLGQTIEDDYRTTLYSKDWDLFISLLSNPDREYALGCFSKDKLHPGNINIFKSELYEEFCCWAFPVLDAFYRLSPEKKDVYQHRDVGFIAERMSHMFVCKKMDAGYEVYEAPLMHLDSEEWSYANECDLRDPEQVWTACSRLYATNQITKCCNVLGAAMKGVCSKDERLNILSEVMTIGILERRECEETMHEYLPEGMKANLDILIQTFQGYKQIVQLFMKQKSQEALELMNDYKNLTGFSNVVTREVGRELSS